MTKKQLEQAKIEIARKILPYMMNPGNAKFSPLTHAECALMLARSEKAIPSAASVAKLERSGIARLGVKVRSMGISCVADCMPSFNRAAT